MNELPEIGSLYMRRDFWDRHRANIPSNLHMAKGCSKKPFLERDQRVFAAV